MIGDFPDAVQAQTPARTSERPFHGHLAFRGLHLTWLGAEDDLLDRVPQDAEPAGLPAATS